MSGPTVRPAVPDDAEAITAIYNEGIEDRVATFETRLRDVAEVAGWLDEGRPLLVAERDGRVVGFARVARYSARPVYDGVGEHAVNVAREARGTGLGTRLLDELVGAAERAGIHKLTSRVFSDNAASRAVHSRRRLRRGRHPAPPRAARWSVARLRARRAAARRRRVTLAEPQPRASAGRVLHPSRVAPVFLCATEPKGSRHG
jgi:L-amino acid N-acyltransferase YncA